MGTTPTFPTPPYHLLPWPRSSIMDTARAERSIPSFMFCTDNFTPQFKRLFSKNLGVTDLQ